MAEQQRLVEQKSTADREISRLKLQANQLRETERRMQNEVRV